MPHIYFIRETLDVWDKKESIEDEKAECENTIYWSLELSLILVYLPVSYSILT